MKMLPIPLQVGISQKLDMVCTIAEDDDFIKQPKDWKPSKHAETMTEASDMKRGLKALIVEEVE